MRNGPSTTRRWHGRNPYVLKVAVEDGGALLYHGARHLSDRTDPQTADVTERWEASEPTVVLREGRQLRHVFGFLVEPFAGLPESTLVHKLAGGSDVTLVSLEPDHADDVAALLKELSAEQVAPYFFLRVYMSEAGGQPNAALARDLLVKRTDVARLVGDAGRCRCALEP